MFGNGRVLGYVTLPSYGLVLDCLFLGKNKLESMQLSGLIGLFAYWRCQEFRRIRDSFAEDLEFPCGLIFVLSY